MEKMPELNKRESGVSRVVGISEKEGGEGALFD